MSKTRRSQAKCEYLKWPIIRNKPLLCSRQESMSWVSLCAPLQAFYCTNTSMESIGGSGIPLLHRVNRFEKADSVLFHKLSFRPKLCFVPAVHHIVGVGRRMIKASSCLLRSVVKLSAGRSCGRLPPSCRYRCEQVVHTRRCGPREPCSACDMAHPRLAHTHLGPRKEEGTRSGTRGRVGR